MLNSSIGMKLHIFLPFKLSPRYCFARLLYNKIEPKLSHITKPSSKSWLKFLILFGIEILFINLLDQQKSLFVINLQQFSYNFKP